MSDTPTPETDAIIPHYVYHRTNPHLSYYTVPLDHARRLERERDAARARVAELEAEHERNRAGKEARKEMMDEFAKLKDPVAVHINMLRGTIATPSPEAVEYAKALNRRVDVENVLYQVASGKRGPLTPDECRELANKLGVSPA